ncbi:MAG: hypothetical protein R3E04_05900 [Sphingobium sp.]
MDIDELTVVARKLMTKTPAWVRHDLNSADKFVRARAEDVLTARLMDGVEKAWAKKKR